MMASSWSAEPTVYEAGSMQRSLYDTVHGSPQNTGAGMVALIHLSLGMALLGQIAI